MTLDDIQDLAASHGLTLTGAFHPGAADGAPEGAVTLALFGYGGPEMWAVYQTSPEASDGAPHPLDRWSARVIGDMARQIGGEALFPFGGPPYQPFIRWTYLAEPIHQSRLGMSIHEERGLWSGWRGAISLPTRLEIPAVNKGDHPCPPCAAPCRSACPVNAFTDAGYDTKACRAHLNSADGAPCRDTGCLARRACPVGADMAHSHAQAAFHLDAFRRA